MKFRPKSVAIDWMETIWKTELNHHCKYLACYLRTFMNNKNDMAWPSYARIIAETGLSRQTISRYLSELESEGWLIINRGHPGKNSTYLASFPDALGSSPEELDIPPNDIQSSSCEELCDDSEITLSSSSQELGVVPHRTGVVPVGTKSSSSQEHELNNELNNELNKSKPKRKTLSAITLKTYLKNCKEQGISAIPEKDPIFDYAEKIKLPRDLMLLAWFCFKRDCLITESKQKDWPATFRNCVKGNWKKVWWINPAGDFEITSTGRQIQLEMDAAANHVS